MPLDAWLPIGFQTPTGERVKRVVHQGAGWQIYETKSNIHILLAQEVLAKRWLSSGILDAGLVDEFTFGSEVLYELLGGVGYVLDQISTCRQPETKSEVLAFVEAMRASRKLDPKVSLHDSIYCERISRLLPTYTLSPTLPDEVVLGAWISGGVPVPAHSFRRLNSLTPWLDKDGLKEVVKKAGFSTREQTETGVRTEGSKEKEGGSDDKKGKGFKLAGRPYLERFFNEHVVDIIENQERYKALGIEFPSAVIMHGPPGCGKTYAVERLVDYLEWPSFKIEASSVASPYIHETSKKVAEVFENAMENAPSVLIIDEMEAFLSDRQSGAGTSQHRVEEVAEFLRRIPEAVHNHVLIVAMTNRIDMIDPAILRRGRFDHVIEVDMASEEEVLALLLKMVAETPHEEGINVANLANKLAGRPLSDVAFVVREGARLSARAGGDKLTEESLLQALESTPARNQEDESHSRKIGFIWNDD